MTGSDQSDRVREQYEALPYPERDPADEAKRLVIGSPSQLGEIRHYLFQGGMPERPPFRALVAGGGTGDAFIMLAQQLADAGIAAEVTHLDLSSASQGVARARAEARGLDNTRFVLGEIEHVKALAPGPYDYIDCCGVLHHLADPTVGLKALVEQLAPDGGMGLMVYGALGRTGVYHTQEAMRLLAADEPDNQRLGLVKRLLKSLPSGNWLKRNPFVGDHVTGGDAGIFDLLLHARDRAYTVPELLGLITAADLKVARLIQPALYEPETYLDDPTLLKRARALPADHRWALAELLSGAITKHIAYVVPAGRAEDTEARPDDLSLVPVFLDLDPAEIAKGIKPGGTLTAELGGHPYKAPLPALAPVILRLCDGRNLAEILAAIRAESRPDLSEDDFRTQFAQFFAAFQGVNRMVLRSPEE